MIAEAVAVVPVGEGSRQKWLDLSRKVEIVTRRAAQTAVVAPGDVATEVDLQVAAPRCTVVGRQDREVRAIQEAQTRCALGVEAAALAVDHGVALEVRARHVELRRCL